MSNSSVDECWRAALSRDANQQLALWTRLIPGLLQKEGSEEALVDLVFGIADRLAVSPRLQASSTPVITTALGNPKFRRAFAAALLRSDTSKLAPRASLIFLQWSGLLIASLDLESGAKAIAKVVEFQASLLAKLARGSRGEAASAIVGRALRRAPALLPAYLEVLRSGGSAHLAAAIMLAVAGKEEQGTAGAATLGLFCSERGLGAREAPTPEAMAAWRLASRAWGPKELAGTLAPAFERALRRAPDATLGTLAALAPGFAPGSARASAAFGALLPQLVSAARAGKESTRAAALRALAALGTRLPADDAARGAAARAALALFSGAAEGKIKGVPERACLAQAAALLAPSFADLAVLATNETDGDEDSEAAGVMAEAVAAYAGEASEDGRLGLLEADGVLAALALARLASVDAGARAALQKSGLLEAGSPLLQPATAAKLPPAAAAAAAELAGLLLERQELLLGRAASQDVVPLLCDTLVLLLLHHDAATRKAASDAAGLAKDLSPALSGQLAASLQRYANAPGSVTVASSPPAPNADPESSGPGPQALGARYVHALFALLPSAPTPDDVARCALLSHSAPLAAARRGGGAAVWAGVARALGGRPALQRLLERPGAAQAALDRVLAPLFEAAGEAHPVQPRAALGALRSLIALAPSLLLPTLLHALGPALDATDHDALSASQLRTYFTQPGRLSSETRDGSIMPTEVLQRVLASSRTGGAEPSPQPATWYLDPAAGSPDVASAATPAPSPASSATANGSRVGSRPSAAPTAKTAGAKPRPGYGAGAGKDAAVEAKRKQLAVEEELSRPVLRLLTSPLVGDGAAMDALSSMAHALPAGLGRMGGDVAACRRLVAYAELSATPDYQPLLSQPCFGAALAALQRATGGEPASEDAEARPGDTPLPGPSARFCFPILRAVLSAGEATPLHGIALDVLGLHVGASTGLSPSDTLALLYRTLEVLPVMRERVQPLLCTLCASLSPDDGDAMSAALAGLRSARAATRGAALRALRDVPAIADGGARDEPTLCALWVARSDGEERNAAAALALWDLLGASLPAGFVRAIVRDYLPSREGEVRAAAAAALAAGLLECPAAAPEAMQACLGLYGRDGAAPEAARLGAVSGLEAIAPQLTVAELPQALDFLLSRGLLEPVPAVQGAVVLAGVALVNAHGKHAAATMLPLFEETLARKSPGLSEEQSDYMRQGVVVLLGTLARHLPAENPKIRDIVGTLLQVLNTPSEAVQRRVSDCLPPLMQVLQQDRTYVESVTKQLLGSCLKARGYGERRGAAFGLAGVVKGLGIGCLKNFGVLDTLKAAVQDKGGADGKEGALLAYECLSEKLGRLFEPYVVSTLPNLLSCFGDSSAAVREAASAAARTIMGQLSAQGVRLVMPALLQGVEDKAWRTKEGSIQLLGAMAFCNPRQLGTALPAVVPHLGQALSDPHPRVASAAQRSLDEVASVIRNPEVKRLVPTLLAALGDPNKHTRKMLDMLLSTVFVNTVDAASLALIMPVVQRGLKDRSGDIKKRAARIVGNLSALANDPRDMAPYVARLLPELQAALVDPLPEVRATSARAVGTLVRGMGPAAFSDLVPWLLTRLGSEASGVERSGAAQGLAEVLAVQGDAAVEALLPRILEGARARSAAVREGHVTLFKYLPGCMPAAFRVHLARVLPVVLLGLADEAEGVRDAALSAARVAVDLYATSALELLLPAVEAGIMNANWRIRQSSIELLGDLLFKVAGTSGRIQQDLQNEEDEGISVEAHGRAIAEALGNERRCQVLSLLYMARSDEAFGVRGAALHVWKTVVTNTPKTLGEILPALMAQVIRSLADPAEDPRAAAGRCLGELVRKMGERVLSQIVPILREGMNDPSPQTRQGVCSGLRDVLENAARDQLAQHLPSLLPAIQAALCDPDPEVRLAAGGVFNVLFKSGGAASLDSVVPALLASLDAPEAERQAQALEGLRVILGVRPSLLGSMLPRLTRPPPVATKLRALGTLCEVAGAALHAHLGSLLPALLALTSGHPDVSPATAAAHDAQRAVVLAVQEDGLYLLIAELLKGLDDDARRVGAAVGIGQLCRGSRLDFQEHIPALIASLVPALAEESDEEVVACWEALAAVTGSIPKEMQPNYVRCLKDAVLATRDKERRKRTGGPLLVKGFCLPKALGPVLPIYLQGMLQGSAELREVAAEGLGQLVEITGEEALRPYVVQSTGPLIRIIGDRFPWQVKAAILRTLGILIAKAGAGLKPFVPQLQTTFVKCLLDPEPRAYLVALAGALAASGDRASPDALSRVGGAVQDALARAGEDEEARAAAARALGALCPHVPPGEARALLAAAGCLGAAGAGAAASGRQGDRLGAALTAAALTQHASRLLTEDAPLAAELCAAIASRFGRDPYPLIKQAAGAAAGRLAAAQLQAAGSAPSLPKLVPLFVSLLGSDQDSDVQRTMLGVLRRLASSTPAAPAALAPYFPDLVPSLLAVVQETSGTTKLSAERTLARVLGLASGDELLTQAFLEDGAGTAARRQLTEAYVRRLTRLPPGDEDDDVEF
ncbi:Translational activator GCN1 [Auxenochlorella protothecoides]|uniref:Translational activator GCN1 n=1 Tax=Auxenochlorella protothecoides TaxID=3075 RepID=A0A087SIT9_AUXPR|nr:Translational activator GCN1 [Auxenochlorella protothecoides]KFM25643.1 Translational activator GCN1 [Auxenochlorella protothecoides]